MVMMLAARMEEAMVEMMVVMRVAMMVATVKDFVRASVLSQMLDLLVCRKLLTRRCRTSVRLQMSIDFNAIAFDAAAESESEAANTTAHAPATPQSLPMPTNGTIAALEVQSSHAQTHSAPASQAAAHEENEGSIMPVNSEELEDAELGDAGGRTQTAQSATCCCFHCRGISSPTFVWSRTHCAVSPSQNTL